MSRRRPHSVPGAALLLSVLLLGGCALPPRLSVSGHLQEAGEAGRCAGFFQKLDRITLAGNAIDAGEGRIAGYPYLRVNRLLASFRGQLDEEQRFQTWLDHLLALDRQARGHEINNLPQASWREVFPEFDRSDLKGRVRDCGDILRAADFTPPADHRRLLDRAVVADEYQVLPRILGLYPLSSLAVAQGVSIWHREARAAFSNAAPRQWRLRRYAYAGPRPPRAKLRAELENIRRDALGFPRYPQELREALFALHAPLWVVRQASADDLIGAPFWKSPGRPGVDSRRPRTYTRLSYSRFHGQILTQLNYIIWFPARSRQHWLDIYAGPLDGINLRITLDSAGDPLLYETIHNCGCYYKAYPTRRLRPREDHGYPEPPLFLSAPQLKPGGGILALGLQGASHYVEHLYPAPAGGHPGAIPYRLLDYDELLSLDDGAGGRDSLFSATGTVPASARPERFILWLTGVYSPGAMRQWGRHPVAFVGERHFDDPRYLERMFTLEQ